MLEVVKVEFRSRNSNPGFSNIAEWVVIRELGLRGDQWDMFSVEFRSRTSNPGFSEFLNMVEWVVIRELG